MRQRTAHLNAEAAKWQLFELDERAEICEPLDCADSGNIVTRLIRAVDADAARERFAASIARMQALAPAAEITIESASEIVFRLHGLEFARACSRQFPARSAMLKPSSSASGPPNMCSTKTTKRCSAIWSTHLGAAPPRRLAHQPALPSGSRALAGIA